MAPFKAILSNKVTVDDEQWTYTVDNLPREKETSANRLIKLISVVSNATSQEIQLTYTKAPSNRATNPQPLSNLALISFADFRLRHRDNSNPEKTIPAPAKDSTSYIARLLTRGITINDTTYNFFGHSNSQLKSRSCFLLAEDKAAIHNKIEGLGDFKKIKTVAKKAKRIGLLFSSTKYGIELQPDRCEDVPDIENQDFNFTDGCGSIAPHFLKQLVKHTPIIFRGHRYLPSVVQIRYRGYKGVLIIEPNLSGRIQVRFRKSMRKFSASGDLTLSVVDHAKVSTAHAQSVGY
jgi:hypothetical protein